MRRLPFFVLPLLATLALATPPATAPTPCDVTVDPRVELISLLFRLAGNSEYDASPRLTAYTADADAFFAPFRDHRAVRLARDLANRHGVGYDAPMSLACHLTPFPDLAERIPFRPRPSNLDPRLALGPTREFLAAAREFAKDSNFQTFLTKHNDLYATATARMQSTLAAHARLDWFASYFGPDRGLPNTSAAPRPTQFHLILGLLNGPCNYGTSVPTHDADHLYSILGAWSEDDAGLPTFDTPVLPTVIHEFGHSYVNPIVDAHLDSLEPAGQKIFARHARSMASQAYGQWPTMIRESVLRAVVARYRLQHDGPLAYAAELAEQTLRGFPWTPALAARLAEYESHRDQYPTLDSFMPQIADFFTTYAASLK